MHRTIRISVPLWALLAIFFLTNSALARTVVAPPDKTQDAGTLEASSADGEEVGRFPLQHTDVKAEISGFITRVTVTQFYENPFDKTIEAIYTFPLPDGAAVDRMDMLIGDRKIAGQIKKRAEAKAIYDAAKQQGRTASLLTQERANIFTQALANIHPGDKVRIQISYVETLVYEDGRYTFRFPMVVGPRYIPGAPLVQNQAGSGWAQDTSLVPDASRITPPVLKPGQRSGHDISVSVKLDAGVPIHKLSTPSHNISNKKHSASRRSVLLDPSDSIPNKDFVLHYHVAGKRPELAVLAQNDPENGGHFMLLVQPKADFRLKEITPKEMVFVVDNSGSMSGQPMAACKGLVRKALKEMNPDDTFQILRFSERASGMARAPIANTPANVKRGLKYIDSMRGMGGTNMIEGIKAALDIPEDSDRMRVVWFLTDGYIGNDDQILAAIQQKIGNARLFALGVGSSPNTYLLNNMAWNGRGAVDFIRPNQKAQAFVDRFYNRISSPYLTDIKIDWKGLEVEEVLPKRIPDLYTGQPLVVYGRYKKGGRARVVVNGKIRGRNHSFPVSVTLPSGTTEQESIGAIWARNKIKRLNTSLLARYNRNLDKKAVVEEITDVALRYRLMSQYTAFVAVEKTVRRKPDGTIETVVQPVEMPEFVSHKGVFGRGAGTRSSIRSYKRQGSVQLYNHAPTGQAHGMGRGYSGSGSGGGGIGVGHSGLKGVGSVAPPTPKEENSLDKESGIAKTAGVKVKISTIQGGSSNARKELSKLVSLGLRKRQGCLQRRSESKASHMRIKLTFAADGTVADVDILDQGTVGNLTVRCLLFALKTIYTPTLSGQTFKLSLNVSP